MSELPQTRETYLRAPRLTLEGDDVVLTVIAWDPAGERLVRHALADDGSVRTRAEGPTYPRICAVDPRTGEPTDDSGVELEAWDGDAHARVRHDDGVSSVLLSRDGRETVVFRARGIAVAPAVAAVGTGTWVAYHHDVREDTGIADVAKWIALRFVDRDGRVFEPSAPMRDRDRDREGEQQSFEFPSLVVGSDGAVALFGRGSHDFYRQDVGAAGWSSRQSRSDGEWGSRGRRIASIRKGPLVFVARRDRKAIVVSVEPEPAGGPPALVAVRPDATPIASAPAQTPSNDPASRWGRATYFGDIQQHSAHSDGLGSADEAYLRARHRYSDDFVALTDHESFLGKRTSPGEWSYLEDVADRHDAPTRFVALHAYEWTGARYPGPGHKCVYPPRRGLPLVSRDDVPRGTDLVEALRAQGGLASPHHIGWTGADAEAHAEDVTPVWEICSCHGCYEHADHPLGQRGEHRDQLVDVMLRRGLRFGFTASSDSHGLLYHHGESRKRDPYRTGLTAVQVATLDRASILDALRTRRCYATSGVKILLDVEVNGAPMGSFLDGSQALEARARVVGAGELERIDWMGPDGVLASAPCSGLTAEAHGTFDVPFVYARVVQRDGEMAWSSPVFRSPR